MGRGRAGWVAAILARKGGPRQTTDSVVGRLLAAPVDRMLRAMLRALRTTRPTSTARFTSGLSVIVLGLLLGGCADEPRCETGLCPAGFQCEPSTGQCQRSTTATEGALRYVGRVHRDPQRSVTVGYVPAAESLMATWPDADGRQVTAPIDGPALDGDRPSAGQASATFAVVGGPLHVAYLRTTDGSVGYAVLDDGPWHREDVAPAGSARGRAIAVASTLPSGPPVVAWQRADGGGPVVARRTAPTADSDAVWGLDAMPPPPGRSAAQMIWGREVALLGRAGAVALGTVDLATGAVVLGLWSPAGWDVAQLTDASAGRASGAVALTSTADGGLVVVWRDGRSNRVLATSAAPDGTVHTAVVDDGRAAAADGHAHVVGTALAATRLVDGRLVVASQDASAARVRLAIQQPSGGFSVQALGGASAPLLFPTVSRGPDGDVLVHAVAVQPGLLPPAGAVQVWPVADAQVQP